MKKYILLLITAILIIGFNSCQKNLQDTTLNHFHLLEAGMNRSYENAEKRCLDLRSTIEFHMMVLPENTTPYYKKAEIAVKATKVFVEFVEKLQKDFETNTGGRLENGRLAGAKEIDYHNNILFNESKGVELRQKINELRITLTALFDSYDKPYFKTDLYTDSDVVSNPSWETNTFNNTPLVAAMAILSKIKTDAKNAEAEVLRIMLRYTTTKIETGFSTHELKVIPKSTYVRLGDEYEAAIFLAAYDTVNHTIYVNGKQLPVENGVGKYKVKPSREGEVKFSGELHVIDAMGRKKIYGFEHSFEVYKPCK